MKKTAILTMLLSTLFISRVFAITSRSAGENLCLNISDRDAASGNGSVVRINDRCYWPGNKGSFDVFYDKYILSTNGGQNPLSHFRGSLILPTPLEYDTVFKLIILREKDSHNFEKIKIGFNRNKSVQIFRFKAKAGTSVMPFSFKNVDVLGYVPYESLQSVPSQVSLPYCLIAENDSSGNGVGPTNLNGINKTIVNLPGNLHSNNNTTDECTISL